MQDARQFGVMQWSQHGAQRVRALSSFVSVDTGSSWRWLEQGRWAPSLSAQSVRRRPRSGSSLPPASRATLINTLSRQIWPYLRLYYVHLFKFVHILSEGRSYIWPDNFCDCCVLSFFILPVMFIALPFFLMQRTRRPLTGHCITMEKGSICSENWKCRPFSHYRS